MASEDSECRLGIRSFLLIARTGRIVTAHARTLLRGYDMASTAGYSGFPAYSRLHFDASNTAELLIVDVVL